MEHSLEQALRQEYAYVKIQNFLITHSYLFSDAEFKVLMALYSMLDYRFEFTFVPVSRRELSIKTGKARGKIYQILKSLEGKGVIQKISGAKNKELAFKLREKFYKQKQNKIRSYNEKNVYDLKPLLEMATFLMAKLSEIQDEEIFMDICLTALTTYKNPSEHLFIKLLRGFKDAGYSNQMAIDKQKPITSNNTTHTHTKCRATTLRRKEGKQAYQIKWKPHRLKMMAGHSDMRINIMLL